jgi:hypothetical protein
VLLVGVAIACREHDEPAGRRRPSSTGDRAAASATGAPAGTPPGAARVFVSAAVRCGECHEKMREEWRHSGHSRAASSPLYAAARASAGDPSCDRCHVPLAARHAAPAVAGEGVTCDVCHTLRDVTLTPGGAEFELAVTDVVKYGPRCDLADHYFHRMGCSPLHREARLCAACHQWRRSGARGSVPVLTEYEDWEAGPAGDAGLPCQSCHMPGTRAAIATGSRERDGVPHHGMLGTAADLRRRALALRVELRAAAGGLEVVCTLRNEGAGHHVPAGLPERRIVVRLRVVAADGEIMHSEERALGRHLVDANGQDAPFWRAVAESRDTRIPPRAARTEHFRLPAGAGAAEVTVLWRGMSDELDTQLGGQGSEEQLLAEARIDVPARRPGAAVRLPRPVVIPSGAAGRSQ